MPPAGVAVGMLLAPGDPRVTSLFDLRTALVPAALALGLAACTSQHAATPAVAGAGEPTVGLVLRGSAVDRPDAQGKVVAAVAERTRGHVVVLDVTTDGNLDELRGRLRRAHPRLPSDGFRAPRCARHADVALALAHGVDAVWRITADRVERARPLDAAEAADASGALHALATTVRFAHRGVAREESVVGSLVTNGFGPHGERSAPIARTVTHVEPGPFTSRVDATAVVVDAVRGVELPGPPAWEAVSRRMLRDGCPALALAIADARLAGAPGRAVRAGAVQALAGTARPQRAGKRTPAPKPEPEPPATPTDEAIAPPVDDRPSCRALCNMHMVELCNQDRSLWDANRRTWETTPCGTMRDEDFLQSCYRQQWLSGAFHDACLRPCEATAEGRDQLLRLLQGAGCLRPRRS
jgi:hypothetical protein